ncbi:TonB-dependent receptor [Fodinibius sp. Rm-B-1B1-1]|uniref:SusC/RagA family TonB-linked outer membrane protein n=1 Tax=Fodinibius alkaliphilus TaxID=3140241 RepID=UPI003159F41C
MKWKGTDNKWRRCLFMAIASFLLIGMTNEANAQYYTSNTSQVYENDSYYLVEQYSDNISELSKTISYEATQVPIKSILQSVAKEGELGIAFNADLDFLQEKKDVSFKNVKVGTALQEVLKGTGYQAGITRTREIVLVKKAPLDVKDTEQALQDISGRVVDAETGEPLPGVNIFVEGTNTGTTSDENGEFSLTIPDDSEVLVFSFIGYERLEVEIGDRTTFNVEMSPDVEALEDVVVVGYGTQQKNEVTGSITSVQAEDLQLVPESSFESALQGKMAGVNVASPTGEPGSSPQITIRGTGSISAGNDPLIVVDGVPLSKNSDLQGNLESRRASFQPQKANPMATINPKDIQSIEVLKDASASAIYGSRGSNGVILITTKSGSKDDFQVNFSAYGGVSSVMNKPHMMNAEEIIEYTQDSRNNALNQDYPNVNYDAESNQGRIDPQTGDELGTNYLLPDKYVNWDGTDTDWLDLVLSDAAIQNYDLSLSGGSENIRYSISGGYLNQGGIVEGSSFDRYSLRANVIADVSDAVELGVNVNSSFSQHDRLPAGAPYFASPPGIIYSAMVHSPVIKPRNPDGTPNQLNGQSYLGGGTTTASNPLAIMDAVDETIKNNRIFGNVYGQYTISDNFEFKSMLGYDIDDYQRSFYLGNDLLYRTATEPDPYAQSSAAQGFNWVWENTLNYSNTFGDHSINALAGYTAQMQQDERNMVFAENFPDDQVKTISGGVVTSGDQVKEEWSLVSALARVNYTYQNKYLLTATIRSDRSSRFGPNNQTGIFPSGSLGWRLTEESFMSGQDLFNELKLRVSYGVTGNFSIPNYGSVGLLEEANYILNDSEVSGLGPETIGDENLSWETTYSMDVGLDFALMEDRIYGSVDYYDSITKDLLLDVTVPSVTGYTTALTNIGEVSNKGFEFQITSRNIVGDFQWSTDLNFGSNQNEVQALGPQGDPIISAGGAGQRHITRIGDEIGSYYGYVVDGIYQSQEEIDNAPNDTQAGSGGARPGDFRFKDVNGDGQITPDDRTVTGSYHPDFTYGITNRFAYKGFDMNVFIQGVQGREILNLTARHMRNGEANFNSYAVLNNRWRSPDNPGNGEHPRADRLTGTHGNNNRPSSYQVEDGSYLRIKRVTLGYNLPNNLIGKYARSVRVYGSVNNLAIFTDYTGFNPEVSLQASNSLTPGEDYGAYPLSRTIQLGIDISF